METKIVTLKGIIRNTSAAVSDDGAFDELMNLRHKDGSLKAISDNVEIEWTTGEDGQEVRPEHLSEYAKIFVHNASNYKHLLGIRGGKLYWFAKIGTQESSTDDYTAEAIEEVYLLDVATSDDNADNVFFSQIGNLVCVADGERLKYLLYRTDQDSGVSQYVIADNDFNGTSDATSLIPEGLIDIRVTADTIDETRQRVRYYRDVTETEKPFYENGMLDKDGTFQDELRACIKANYARAFEQNAKDGRIDGWFLAVTALELYDGSTILMSRPVLCAQANDEGTRYDLDNSDGNDGIEYRVGDQDVRKWNYQTHPFLMNAYLPKLTGELKDKKYAFTVNYSSNSQGTQRRCILRNDRSDNGIENDENKFIDMPATFSGKYQVADDDSYNTTEDTLTLEDGTQVLPLDTMCMTPGARIENAIYEFEGDLTNFKNNKITFRTTTANAVPTAAVRAKGANIKDDNSFECCIADAVLANVSPSLLTARREIYARDTMRLSSIPNAFAIYMAETKNTRHYDNYVNNATNSININGQDANITPTYNENASSSALTCENLVYPGYGDNELGYGVVISCANKLQYRCNDTANDLYADIIKSVNVYITMPVNSYDIEAPLNNIYYRDPCYRQDEPMGVCAYLKHKSDREIIEELMGRSSYYKVKSIPYTSIKKGDWIDIDLKSQSILLNLVQQERLDIDSMGRNNYVAQYVYTYNGRVHLANYKSYFFKGYPMNYFVQNYDEAKVVAKTSKGYIYGYETNASQTISQYQMYHGQKIEETWKLNSEDVAYDLDGQTETNYENISEPETGIIYCIETDIVTTNGKITVRRYLNKQNNDKYTLKSLNPLLTYPDARATKIRVIWYDSIKYDGINAMTGYWYREFDLKPHTSFNMAYHISEDLKPINVKDKLLELRYLGPEYDTTENNIPEYHPNGLKVSQTNNPFFFPDSATYQVGNSSIIAMAANTQALSTGQWGDAPLYVFCTDGIYALFVDSTGQLTYSNSRPISREICNNANSVTPIDDAIIFTTDRGLMMLAGSEATEISQAAEGKVYDMLNNNCFEHLLGLSGMLNNSNHLTSSLKDYIADNQEYAEYLKDVRIGYNYIERELYVTNPAYGYSYVYSNDAWTKTDKTCRYYVQDYPKTYAYDGLLKDLNVESNTGNETCFITRPIKFASLSERQNYRIVLRGNFVMNTNTLNAGEDNEATISKTACMIVYGSNDCNKWQVIGLVKKPDVPTVEQRLIGGKLKCYDINNRVFRDLGCTLYSQQVKYIKVAFVGDLAPESTIEHLEVSVFQPNDKLR